jgi:hypothetical protein
VAVGIWWIVDAKKKYTGPVRTIDEVPMEETPDVTTPAPAPGS